MFADLSLDLNYCLSLIFSLECPILKKRNPNMCLLIPDGLGESDSLSLIVWIVVHGVIGYPILEPAHNENKHDSRGKEIFIR
jgi:hypothetical protein